MAISAKIEKGNLVITIPVNEKNPPLSSSGKTHIVAGTGGFTTLEGVQILGKTVSVSVNATIKA